MVIQTYNPSHAVIRHAVMNAYQNFAKEELELRRELHYPPFSRLVRFRIQGNLQSKVVETSGRLAQRAQGLVNHFKAFHSLSLLGPSPAPMSRLRGKYRYHLLIKFKEARFMEPFLEKVMGDFKWVVGGTKVQVDVDPVGML